MNTFAIRPLRDYPKVTFFTVALNNSEETEWEKFYDRWIRNDHSKHSREMMALIARTGTLTTALPQYFRNEAVDGTETKGMPPRSREYAGNRLRLYCKVLSPHVVVTFGGGLKTRGGIRAQDCEVVKHHFAIANGISAVLDEELEKCTQIGLSADGKTLEYNHEDWFVFKPNYK